MAYDKDKPASSTSLRNSNPQILANQAAIETALNREHTFSTGGTATDQAHHKKGSARAYFQDAEPATRVDGEAFTSDDLGSLWFDTNSSPDNIFSLLTATTPTWTPVSVEIIATLLASNRIFAGTLKSTGDFTVGANKVVITAANGNTVIAGVVTMGDTSALATSGAPVADAQIANKKYVDDTYLAGQAVQVVNTQSGAVNTGTTQLPYDDSIPQNTEGDEYMTLAITPKSATNKLMIEVVCVIASSFPGAHDALTAALFQDSTANALAGISNHLSFVNEPIILNFKHFMTTGTTSETTFKMRAGSQSAGTTTFNGQSAARRLGGIIMSSITITEIKV